MIQNFTESLENRFFKGVFEINQMELAARNLEFEKAALLRDEISLLKKIKK